LVQIFNYNTTTPLTVTSMKMSGDTADFSMWGCVGQSIPPGTPCQFGVRFVPKTAGPHSATITITDSDPSSPQTVTATGMGSELNIQNMLLFTEQQQVGKPAWRTFQVANNGTTSITINSVSEVGEDYQLVSTTCSGALAPAATCSIEIEFKPLLIGPRWGQVNVVDSDPGSPHEVRLVGNAVGKGVTPATLTEEEMQKYKDDEGDGDDD